MWIDNNKVTHKNEIPKNKMKQSKAIFDELEGGF